MTPRRAPATGEVESIEPRLREILAGVAAFRVLALVWAIAVAVVDAHSGVLTHPLPAFGVLAALALWSGVTGVWAQVRPESLLRPSVIAVDLALAAATVSANWLVYSGSHPQSFGSAWPLAAVVSTGAILGWRPGLSAGLGVGAANLVVAACAGRAHGGLLALSGSLVLWAAAGAVAGYVAGRLRSADASIEAARAREEFARTLHDGVLQTLAAVQRRSSDNDIVELAREQEWQLRDFISHGHTAEQDLVSELRQAAARAERNYGVRVELVVVEAPVANNVATHALAGAAAEAVTNAAKHGHASAVTVCVDRAERGVMVTVNDDGRGFDVDATAPSAGMSRSIRGRIDEVGGRVTIRSWPDRGTEVSLWVP